MAALSRPGEGPGQAGVTLVEVVVALAVTALVLALAARLLVASQVLLFASVREARDPIVEIALRQIRHDVQGSGSVYPGLPVLSSAPMVLGGHPRYGTITYERMPDLRLVRRIEEDGETLERDLLHGVVSWRWGELDDGLVSVRLGVRRQPWRGDPLSPDLDRIVAASSIEPFRLDLLLRGEGRFRGW